MSRVIFALDSTGTITRNGADVGAIWKMKRPEGTVWEVHQPGVDPEHATRTAAGPTMRAAYRAWVGRNGSDSLDLIDVARETREARRLDFDVADRALRRAIIKAMDDGLPVTQIAEAAGVSRQRVHQIMREA